MYWTRVLFALACGALWLPLFATFAQDAAQPGETTTQTIAQGVLSIPTTSVVWQSELQRALVSPRAVATPQPGGFVVADTGALAITAADGTPTQRLAPGDAIWIEPDATLAIVSLESRSAGYLRISLIPASKIPENPGAASHGEAFPAQPGVADLDLQRDILERGEELASSSGDAPALLQVTSGKLFVTYESGEIREVASGSPLQFQGRVTLSGASRTPAAFVVAKLGPQLPDRVALLDPLATPVATPLATPQATPVAQEKNAKLTVEARLCPPGYDKSAPLVACTAPAANVRFTAETEDGPETVLADADGEAAFASLPPGVLSLRANLPDGASTAVASCRNLLGDASGRVRDDALRVSLKAGARVTCAWFIEPGKTWPGADLTVTVLACPPGMTAEGLRPESCTPPVVGVVLALAIDDAVLEPVQTANGVWTWGPLPERSYNLTLSNLPAGFAGAVLDDVEASNDDIAFQIEPGNDAAPTRTLYLLRPPAAEAAELDSDSDSDRLTVAKETELGTDPYLADSDGDALADGDETDIYGTDPLLADTDDDGLDDGEEVAVTFTNPFLVDTDGDGVSDADEIAVQTNPLDMLSLPPTPTPAATSTPSPSPLPSPARTASSVTTAGTPEASPDATPEGAPQRVPAGLPTRAPDASPVSRSLLPTSTPDVAGSSSALDDDGLTTLEEITIHGTDPRKPDTDGDGKNDGDEVASGSDPLDPTS